MKVILSPFSFSLPHKQLNDARYVSSKESCNDKSFDHEWAQQSDNRANENERENFTYTCCVTGWMKRLFFYWGLWGGFGTLKLSKKN